MADQVQNVIVRMRAEGVDAAGQQVERFAKKSTESLQKNSTAARQAAYEMSQVSMQVTDIVVSLASGQQPLTVFLQQGGQLKDMFGGVGNAAGALGRTVASLVTPFTVAGTAVVGLVAAYYSAVSAQNEVERALRATGNFAGMTAGQFNDLSKALAGVTEGTETDARTITLALVQTGRMGGEAIAKLGEAALVWSRMSGQSAESVAKDFAGMASGVADWAEKHNRSMHFARSAQIEYIRELEESGQAQQAMIEVGNLLAAHNTGMVENLGLVERAWKGITNAVDRYKNMILSVGRDTSQAEQLKALNQELTDVQRRMGGMSESWDGVAINQAKAAEKALQSRIRDLEIEQRDAKVRAANRQTAIKDDEAAAKRREALTKLTDDLSGANSAYAKSIKQIQDAFKAGDIDEAKRLELLTQVANKYGQTGKTTQATGVKANPEADYQKMVRETIANRAVRLADIEAKGHEAANRAAADNMAKTAEMLARRNEQATDFAQQLADQTAQINVGLIADDRARGEAQIELDRQTMQARVDVLAQGGADVAALQEQLNANIVARQQQLTEQLKPEWQRMLDEWGNTTRQMQKTYDDTMNNLLKSSEDMFVKLMTGQKVNVKDFANQILADMARAQFRQFVGEQAKSGGWLGSLLGLSSVKGYSGDEKSKDFMGPLEESADKLRISNTQAGEEMDSLARQVGRVIGGLDGFGSVVLRVAQALLSMASSAGASSSGGWLNALGSFFGFGGGSQTPGDPLTVPTDVPGMSLAVGTNRIPADGWKYLHEGEAVLPKPFNPWAGGGGGGGGLGQNVTINSTVVMNGNSTDSRADLQRMLDQRDAALKAQMIDQLRRTGTAAHRAARA